MAGGGLTCARRPPAPRCHDCPGAEACAAKQGAAVAGADAELALRRAAGEPVDRWGTTAEDFGEEEETAIVGVLPLHGSPEQCPRPCSECGGSHHFSTEILGTSEETPDHPAAVAGLEMWMECKHCEAWEALDLAPKEMAAPDLGVGPPDVGCRQCARGTDHDLADCDDSKALAAWAPAAVPEPWACGACGSTTGAVLYERGPLAGLRRCWPCARPALEGASCTS